MSERIRGACVMRYTNRRILLLLYYGTTPTEVTDIWLQFTTHLSTPKGWQAEV